MAVRHLGADAKMTNTCGPVMGLASVGLTSMGLARTR
jgi:hypothetical protein